MKRAIKLAFAIVLSMCAHNACGQNDRINTGERIGWYNYFGTFKLSQKFGLHTEYQWRRDNYITDWQQSMLRVGVNYQSRPSVSLRAGYAWVETFPYGEIPINGQGRDFTEHRIFQMAQLAQKKGVVDISHRFMLEQRFVGRYSSANVSREDEFPLLHRMRYMLRFQLPLRGKEMKDIELLTLLFTMKCLLASEKMLTQTYLTKTAWDCYLDAGLPPE